MSVRDGVSDIEALRLTRREYRAVLDHQIALLNDLDDKAMWTARTAVVMLGILVSGAGLAGRTGIAALPPAARISLGIGGMGLVVSIFAGVGAYTVSEPRFGVTDSHYREVTEMVYTEREWLDLLLEEYVDWSGKLQALTTERARQVFLTQTFLIGSLAILFIAIMLLTLGV